MKKFNEDNGGVKISWKGFHYWLASEEENEMLTGYRHNAVTPFMFNENIPIVLSEKIA